MTDTTQPTVEQLNLIRTSFYNAVHAKYVEFINTIKNLPIYPAAFNQAFVEFDTGILWAKEAIFHGAIIQPAPAPVQEVNAAEESGVVLDATDAPAA